MLNGGDQSVGAPAASASPAPAATAPTTGQQMGSLPSWANARAELGFALAGKKDVADVIHRQYQVTQGPGGTLMRNGQIVGQVIPNAGMVIDGKFQPLPKEATDALVGFEGAKAGAVKAAENPYQITEGVDAQGRPVKGYAPSVFGAPPTGQPNVGAIPPGTRFNFENAPPNEVAAALRDAASGGGKLVGPNPLAMKAAESAIATQAAQNTDVAKAFGNDYVDMVKAEKGAPANIQKYQYLKGLWGDVNTGKFAPTTQAIKATAAYFAPDLAKSFTKDVPAFQAAQALSNAMALELRNPAGGAGMPGSLSDADRQYLQSMISSAQNDPRAIPLILDAKISLEKRNQDLGRIARDYRASHGGVLDEGVYQAFQDYSNAHPLFKQAAPASALPQGWKIERVTQ
jgi:hypothetical protein